MPTVAQAGTQLTGTSAPPPTIEARIRKARVEGRDALIMAESLQHMGAPPRDVKYALDRADMAAARELQLRQS